MSETEKQSETQTITIFSNQQGVSVELNAGETIRELLERAGIESRSDNNRILMNDQRATLDTKVNSVDDEIILLGQWDNGNDKKKVNH